MAPRKKALVIEIPDEDVTIHILGLKTLIKQNMSLDGMAAYYSCVMGEPYSRRTIKRKIDTMIERIGFGQPIDRLTKAKLARRTDDETPLPVEDKSKSPRF